MHSGTAVHAVADIDTKPGHTGVSDDFGLILVFEVLISDLAVATGASLRQRNLDLFIDSRGDRTVRFASVLRPGR